MKTDHLLKKKELIDLTCRLIQIPTENPPGNEKEAVLFLKPFLAKMGFRVNVHLSPKGRYNLVAEKRWGKGGRNLIFNGHIDVVPSGDPAQWKFPPYGATLYKGRIYGRGASDMKGGIASFIHAISMVDRSNIPLQQGSLILHLVSDEESHGHQGMGFLAQQGGIRADAALVGEPTNLDLIIAQKGALWFKITTFGKSAHGSRPSQGINAIEKMMKLMETMKSMVLTKEHPLLGKPTINIGKIQGGAKVNMVPERCEIEVDRRLLPNEHKKGILREIKQALESARAHDPILKYQIDVIDYAEPSEIHPDQEIVRIGLKAGQEVMGRKPTVRGFSGFTDARFYINQFHIPALIFGPGGTDQSHTTDESVEVDNLIEAAKIYAKFVLKFFGFD